MFEIQGQIINRTIKDINIKDDNEASVLKETLKKDEVQWKIIQNTLLSKLAGYSQRSDNHSERIFTIIRFQIQLLNMTANMLSDLTEKPQDRLKIFGENLTQNLIVNMIKYFKLNEKTKSPNLTQDSVLFNELQVSDPALSQTNITDLYDSKLELYWLEIGSVTANQMLKSKHKKIDSGGRQINMHSILSMHNLKKTFDDFLRFSESFSSYYEKYFNEEESRENPIEFIRNFGRLLYLFMKGFSVPSRPKFEDVRNTFNQLFRTFRMNIIIPRVARYMRQHLEPTKSSPEWHQDKNLANEFSVLIYNLFRIIVFSMAALECELLPFCDILKLLYYFGHIVLRPAWKLIKLSRLLHIIMHKLPEKSVKAHQCCDNELKFFLATRLMEFLKFETCHEANLYDIEKEIMQLYVCMYCSLFLCTRYSLGLLQVVRECNQHRLRGRK